MGWFDKLLGVDKAIDVADKTLSSGMNLLDEAFHTDQEKSEQAALLYANWVEAQKLIATQASPTAISRRIIAWGVVSLVWITALVSIFIIVVSSNQAKVDALVSLLVALQIGWAFCTIIIFYFGPHLISAFSKRGK